MSSSEAVALAAGAAKDAPSPNYDGLPDYWDSSNQLSPKLSPKYDVLPNYDGLPDSDDSDADDIADGFVLGNGGEDRARRSSAHRGGVDVEVSFWQMFWMMSAFVGAQMAWGVQTGIATPTFRELGISQSNVAIIWLAGPVSGCIAQPIIGGLSDSCTSRWGRRRPFIAGAAVLVVLTMAIFGNARLLGAGFGDAPSAGGPIAKPAAVIIAVASFWAMDFGINSLQGPLRALASDIFLARQQAQAGGIFALHTGIGNCLSFGLAALNIPRLTGQRLSQLQGLAIAACLIITTLTAVTVCLCAERPIPRGRTNEASGPEGGSQGSQGHMAKVGRVLCGLRATFAGFPRLLKFVFVCQFLTSLGKNG